MVPILRPSELLAPGTLPPGWEQIDTGAPTEPHATTVVVGNDTVRVFIRATATTAPDGELARLRNRVIDDPLDATPTPVPDARVLRRAS